MPVTTFLRRSGQPELRLATWQPAEPKGSVLITPGFAESIERYEHVAARWRDAGFAVAGLTYGLINGQLRSSLDTAAKADGVEPIPLWAWATQVTFLVSVAVLGVAAGAFALGIPAVHVASVVLVVAALVPFTMVRSTPRLTRSSTS